MEKLPRIPITLTVGVAPLSDHGVAIAHYSGRFSRMLTWNVKTLEVVEFQDIKAAAYLLDVSKNGRYCAYRVIAHHKQEHYVAISRPPFFHALWLRSAFPLGETKVSFATPGQIEYCCTPAAIVRGNALTQRVETHCPFKIVKVPAEGDWPSRVSTFRGSKLKDANESRTAPIFVRDGNLFANDRVILDLSIPDFVEVEPPDWAKRW